jgi:3-hydroxybutyryl-CoA dehydratase
MDEEFAKNTMFKGRIAHGMLSAGFISAVLGAHMPGPGAIYLSQMMKLKAPVRIGDTVTARCTVTKINKDRGRVTLDTVCLVGDTVVVDGEANLMIPKASA